jgi:hypothetical protein
MPPLPASGPDEGREYDLAQCARLCRGAGRSGLLSFLPLGGDKDLGEGLEAAIFLTRFGNRFLNDAAADEALELLVGAQPKHFFAAASGLARAQVHVNQLEKGLEFEPVAGGKDGDEFLSDNIRATTRGITAKLCSHPGI